MLNEYDENGIKTLSVKESIESIFLKEMREIIYDHKGARYLKFLNIAVGIEYLGACLDQHPFNLEGHSEDRFNTALKKLFPSKYLVYAKRNSSIYLYEKFRCSFIHQLKPGDKVVVTHREEAAREKTTHLNSTKSGYFVLVLDDFFDDFESACSKLLELEKKGKLPTKKITQDYVRYINIENNR